MERAIEFNSNDRKLILNLIKRTKSAITRQGKTHSDATDFAVEVNLSYGQEEYLWMKGKDDNVYWGLCRRHRFYKEDETEQLGATLGLAAKNVKSHVILYKVMESIMDREKERAQMEALGFTYSPYGGAKSLLTGKVQEVMMEEKKIKEVTLCRFFNPVTLKNQIWSMFEFPDQEGKYASGIDTWSMGKDEFMPMEDCIPVRFDTLPIANLPKVMFDITREFVHRNFLNLYLMPDKIRKLLEREDIN